MILSVSVYSVLLLVKPAHAADVPECPNPGAVAPVPKPGAGAPAPKGVAPFIERGTKPLTGDAKGIFVGGATAICASFFQSGDFMLGFSCAVLIVIGGIVINRTPDQ
jgi:hypothetical protein